MIADYSQLELFYANRFLQDAASMNTLRALENSNSNFLSDPTLIRVDNPPPGWNSANGQITLEIVSWHVSNLQGSICCVAGCRA